MSNLDISFRALRVLDTSRRLFNLYGFHHVGVNRIIESARIPKATFYKYFYSKERLIEMSLTFQKDALKEEVFTMIYKKERFYCF
ncbi:AcrR family transcriptional regulator [Acinetobacter sp. BIGb0196]|nr:AcrR family transcriptional regulator [Acinetobacter guillouiae]MCW2251962.1 AcrR family transcriptional regulator [Acinetobacter sp. BIGb0204]NII38615.1 AcrR family transcriptional regulator [Acinetobacter sp. BIGb0196]